MSTVEFGDLPPKPTKWATIAAQLRARPGEWALVTTLATRGGASASGTAIRQGVYSAMPVGQFEAAVRGCDVWARYVGDDQ